jgi:hypothetical protein
MSDVEVMEKLAEALQTLFDFPTSKMARQGASECLAEYSSHKATQEFP